MAEEAVTKAVITLPGPAGVQHTRPPPRPPTTDSTDHGSLSQMTKTCQDSSGLA